MLENAGKLKIFFYMLKRYLYRWVVTLRLLLAEFFAKYRTLLSMLYFIVST